MADEKQKTEADEQKKILEREYIVPLRREWLKVQKYKRANRAVRALKEFIAQHMKVYDRDLNKIKVDVYLNNELRFRGMKKPLHKVKVKAIKYENGEVVVKLVELPKHIEFELARKARKEAEKALHGTKNPEEKEKKQEEVKTDSEKKEEAEKEKSGEEAMLAEDKKLAKEAKHTSGVKKEPEIRRKALKR